MLVLFFFYDVRAHGLLNKESALFCSAGGQDESMTKGVYFDDFSDFAG